jgi:hypothetical protein
MDDGEDTVGAMGAVGAIYDVAIAGAKTHSGVRSNAFTRPTTRGLDHDEDGA